MSGPTCMQAMGDAMEIFNVQALALRARQLLLASRGQAMTTGALAVALAVPFWVADVVMDALQEQGETLHGTDGWRLSCSATMALALSLPPALRNPATCGAA